MTRIIGVLIALIIFITPNYSFSQSRLVVSDTKTFKLEHVNPDGTSLLGSLVQKSFLGIYNGKTQEYSIELREDTNKKKTFPVPLSKDEFAFGLTTLLNESENPKIPFTQNSLEHVFLWLYSLNQEQDAPNSGKLNLGLLVETFPGNSKNDPSRVSRLEHYTNTYAQLQTSTFSYAEIIRTNLDTIINNKEKAGIRDNTYPEFSSQLNDLKKQFKNNVYPELKDTTAIVHKLSKEEIKNLLGTAGIGNDTIARNKVKESISNLVQWIPLYFGEREKMITNEGEMRLGSISPIEKVSVQFQRGALEKIQVWIRNANGFLDIYENIYAIGYSSIVDYKVFQGIRLFWRPAAKYGFDKGIFLSDVLTNYDNLLDLYTRDYSPADTVINELNPNNGPISLKRARYINLFESKFYTDLQGINPDVPNGLIQLEVSKRFNIHSHRTEGHLFPRTDATYASYFYLYGAITKIEDKARYLSLHNRNAVVNNTIVSPSYVTNLDLQRYENASLGIDLNALLFDAPDAKFTAYVDIGAKYGHVPIADTIYTVANGVTTKTSNANLFPGHTVTFALPKVTFEFFSDRRVGFNLTYAHNLTYAFTSNRFRQIMSYDKSDLNNFITEKVAHYSHMLELNLRIETNRDGTGQLFFRNRWFWQQGDINTFFVQSQLGYLYNIIFRK